GGGGGGRGGEEGRGGGWGGRGGGGGERGKGTERAIDFALDRLGDQHRQGRIGDNCGGAKGRPSCTDTCQRVPCHRRAGAHAGKIRLYQFGRIARCGRAGFGGYSRNR